MFQLYNFLSKQKEDFQPIHPGKVGMYICGPTVYDHCHLGHARGYVDMDVLRRYLEYQGLEVRHIMNYTDVGHLVDDAEVGEDKLEKKAKKEKIDPIAVANTYIQSVEDDFAALNIKPAHFNPRPTKYVPLIIKFVETLIEKGYAYVVNGSVYFSVEKFPGYGKLSGRKAEELLAGARVEKNSEKKNPLDFALWIKATPEHILKWEGPWSLGYPGWHIECSVMSADLLGGDTFDIHGGGNQNVFPHNENEVAQSEAYLGKPMAHFWTLWNMVNIEGIKMSKSLGNFMTVKEAIQKYGAPTIRLWVIGSHYRSEINFTESGLQQVGSNLERIIDWLQNLKKVSGTGTGTIDTADFKLRFEEALNDDLNTPLALAIIHELITETNKLLAENNLSVASAQDILKLWEKINKVLGLELEIESEKIPEAVLQLAEEREIARKNKDFQKSDDLRIAIEEQGFSIEDTKNGFKLAVKK